MMLKDGFQCTPQMNSYFAPKDRIKALSIFKVLSTCQRRFVYYEIKLRNVGIDMQGQEGGNTTSFNSIGQNIRVHLKQL